MTPLEWESLRKRLSSYRQDHLLQHVESLSESEQSRLLREIEAIDFDELKRTVDGREKSVDWKALASKAEPPQAIRLAQAASVQRVAREAGERAIRDGKVAMILVAGGQGTRLGFDKPKGMFKIGPVSNRSLFAMHADSLRGAMKKFGVSIPLMIMTSPATDAQTREYFESHHWLGLSKDQVTIFQQGTMPAVDRESGAVLLESPGQIAMSPDGHGGIVKALRTSGILDDCREQGIEYFYYAQVDNPLVVACDPVLIGHHILEGSQMTTQVVQKRFATEKVGNVVSIDGKTQIIEYSDLPEEIAQQTNADGSLKLWAGNIAVHVMDRSFLDDCSRDPDSLPFHLAFKAVPYCNAEGQLVRPTAPNAIKLERFVFDLLPRASKAIVVEGDAKDVFAPVKNAEGAPSDTPSTARLAISDRAKRWLADAGVECSQDCLVEIHPLWAWDADDVKSRRQASGTIHSDTYFA